MRTLQVKGELRVLGVQAEERCVDPVVDGLARAFHRVRRPARATAQSVGRRELALQEGDLLVERSDTRPVAISLAFGSLGGELAQPPAIALQRPGIQDLSGVSASGHVHSRVRGARALRIEVGRGELEHVDLAIGRLDEARDVVEPRVPASSIASPR